MAITNIYSHVDYRSSMELQHVSNKEVEVFLVPSSEWLKVVGLTREETKDYKRKILHIDGANSYIHIFPTCTLIRNSKFLQPKYDQIQYIKLHGEHAIYTSHVSTREGVSTDSFSSPTFGDTQPISEDVVGELDNLPLIPSTQYDIEAILQSLPQVFTKNFVFGLGFLKKYRFIVNAIEELTSCVGILVIDNNDHGIYGDEFVLTFNDLENARKLIDKADRHCRTALRCVNEANIHNLFATNIGLPHIPIRAGRSSLRKLMGLSTFRGTVS